MTVRESCTCGCDGLSHGSTRCIEFDDRRFLEEELKPDSGSWRKEKYAKRSCVKILDHNEGQSTWRDYDDDGIEKLLYANAPQPQVRFILLQTTPQERLLRPIDPRQAHELEQLVKNEVILQENIVDSLPEEKAIDTEKSVMNITEATLRKVLLWYDIAPATASHIRGQEQVFGSKCSFDDNGREDSFQFWYAIRARAYFRPLRREADLKMTVITRYDVKTEKTVIVLKYRSYNDLPTSLQAALIKKLEELVSHVGTKYLVGNPFTLALFHFSSTIQYYRRGARDPRDIIRKQEVKAHSNSHEVDLREVHLLLGSLDQDKVQLDFILELIHRLREQHEYFYRRIKKMPDPDNRDWLYYHVNEDLNRFESHLTYLRNSVQDVAGKAQRLLDLIFNVEARRSNHNTARMTEHAMYESASMSTISVLTMLFLPGSLVASIFGTNLITQPSPQQSSTSGSFASVNSTKGLDVSNLWWLLPAIIIPLTILTFLGWWAWKWWTRKKIQQKMMREIIPV